MDFIQTYKTLDGFTGGQKGTAEPTKYIVLGNSVISNLVIIEEVIPIKNPNL